MASSLNTQTKKITPLTKTFLTSLNFLLLTVFAGLNSCSQSKNPNTWVEGFTDVSPMLTKRGGAAGVTVNNFIYILGGIDGNDFLKTTERAKINPDGALGPWKESKPLNHARGFFYAIEHKGYIYAIGGANGKNGKNLLSSVERAKINSDGTLGDWIEEKHSMLSVRRCSKAVLIGDYIYAVGGYNGGFIEHTERAKINPDGTLSEWEFEKNPTSIGRYIHATAKLKNRIYVVGGHHETKGIGIDTVEWTTTDKAGHIDKWKVDPHRLLLRRYGHSSFVHNNILYAIGGLDGHFFLKSIEYSKINPDGGTSPWQFSSPLQTPRESAVTLIHNNNLYVLGGSTNNGFLNTVEWTTFKKDGQLGFWVSKDKKSSLIKDNQLIQYKNNLIPSDFLEYFNEGIAYQQKKNWTLAADLYQRSIASNPGFIESYQNLSSTYLELNEYEKTLEVSKKGLLKKNDPFLHYNMACAYSQTKKNDLAIKSLNEAIKKGFDDMGLVETDEDLKNIRHSQGYKKIILTLINKEGE